MKGFYPSREALLNEAVDVLRLREPSDDKLIAALQVGLDDVTAGRVEEWDVEVAYRRYEDLPRRVSGLRRFTTSRYVICFEPTDFGMRVIRVFDAARDHENLL